MQKFFRHFSLVRSHAESLVTPIYCQLKLCSVSDHQAETSSPFTEREENSRMCPIPISRQTIIRV